MTEVPRPVPAAVDVTRVHRLTALGAAKVDPADLAARVVPVEHRRAGLTGEPLVAPGDHDHDRSTSSAPFVVRRYSWRGRRS